MYASYVSPFCGIGIGDMDPRCVSPPALSASWA